MLKLILGPSGAGKTKRLTDQIALDIQKGIKCYYLVPEQQAYISERHLTLSLPGNAGLYLEITDFSGLCQTLFHAYGGVTNPSVEPALRTLIMWDTLRELSPLLQQYGNSAKNDNTLTQLMLSGLSELRNAGITPQMLEDAAQQCDDTSPLKNKLMDIALIDAAYHQKIKDCFGADPEEKLLRMASLLKKNHFFEGAHVYIDSFTSFTAEEYAVIGHIIRQAEVTAVSLCTDSMSSQLPHFQTPCDTAHRLNRLAHEWNIPTQVTCLPVHTAQKNADLLRLEAQLWNFKAYIPEDETRKTQNEPSVKLLKCRNIYEEAEAAAIQISQLTQEGFCYGDIALIMRDSESYRGVLDAALERHGIPYFLSERSDFSSKPLFRLILSALRCICRGYRTQDVMTLVKTGFTGVSVRDASLFEEYCNTWHISGKTFLQDVWSMNPDGMTTNRSARADAILEAANRARSILMDPLVRFSHHLRAADTFPNKCRALFRYLTDIEIAAALSEHAKKELIGGHHRQASEALRLYRLFTDILTKAVTILPNAKMDNDEFYSALSVLFSTTDMGSVPNIQDCVTIGSAATLRVEKIRAAILLGLCEGEFPRNITDDGILSDSEKESLEEYGIVFTSRNKVRFSEELLYVYRAITKPSEKLFLFTVANETDGSARTPSLAFNRVRLLLGTEAEVFDLSALRKLTGKGVQQEAPLLSLPAYPEKTVLRLSQSKIRSFLLCPYSYYASYCLKLREQKDSNPSYADDGNFLHYIFEYFMKQIVGEDGSVALPEAIDIARISDGIILEYMREICPFEFESMEGRLLHIYTRLRRLSQTILTDMVEELRYSAFVPSYFEQIIGGQGENSLPPLSIPLSNGSTVTLSGKIDRVDLYKTADKVYVRVIDYKSGEHKFSLQEVKSGLDIQLILYLWAFIASDPSHLQAAGAAFLYTKQEHGKTAIHRSGIKLSEEELNHAMDASPKSRFTGKLLEQTAAEIEELSEAMKSAVQSAAQRILAGEAQKTPSEDACRFCAVADRCDQAIKKHDKK